MSDNDVAAGEAQARAFREAQWQHVEGTPESLARVASILDEYAPELFPADGNGRVHFARAMMESAADEIRAFCIRQGLAAPIKPPADETGGEA